MPNKYRTLLNDTFIFALGSIGVKFISFFLVPYYTNILTTSEYGSVDLVTSFSNIIISVASLAIHEAVLRFGLSKDVNQKSVISNTAVILTASVFLIICFTPFLRMYDALSPWVPQLALIASIHMINDSLFSYTKVLRRNRLYALVSVLYALVFALLNIFMMSVLKMRVEGYLCANIITLLFVTIILLFFAGIRKDIRLGNLDFPLMKEMLFYSAPLVFDRISWWIIQSVSKIVLEVHATTAALGLFSAASKLPTLLSVVTAIFHQAWVLSAITDYEHGADKKFFSTVFNYYSLIMVLATSVLTLGTKIFMRFYVGAAFYESWRSVPILLFGILFYAYSSFFGSIYSAAKKNKQIAFSTGCSAVVALVLSLVLIPRFGFMGAAAATAGSYVFLSIFRCINSRKYLKVEFNVKKALLSLVILLLQVVATCMDFHVYIVGALTLAALLLVNLSTVKELFGLVMGELKKIISCRKK